MFEALVALVAKVAGASTVAQVAAGLGITVAGVTGAGAVGALPGPVQDTVAAAVETVSPFDLPDSDDDLIAPEGSDAREVDDSHLDSPDDLAGDDSTDEDDTDSDESDDESDEDSDSGDDGHDDGDSLNRGHGNAEDAEEAAEQAREDAEEAAEQAREDAEHAADSGSDDDHEGLQDQEEPEDD